MIDGNYFLINQLIIILKTYDNIRKLTTGQRDDYTTGYLLDYNYFKKHYKMIAIDLSKQQALDADPKAIRQISFTRYLNSADDKVMFFSQVTVKVL